MQDLIFFIIFDEEKYMGNINVNKENRNGHVVIRDKKGIFYLCALKDNLDKNHVFFCVIILFYFSSNF